MSLLTSFLAYFTLQTIKYIFSYIQANIMSEKKGSDSVLLIVLLIKADFSWECFLSHSLCLAEV